MESDKLIILSCVFLLVSSCVTQFIPETDEDQELLVVEGLITDQPGINTIKLSKSMPLGQRKSSVPLTGCMLSLTDDQGNSYSLSETNKGTYVTDPKRFCGIVGRKYTLKILTNSSINNYSYASCPMEMKPVPPIDSIFYEKKTITTGDEVTDLKEGCQVYLTTHDPAGICTKYRWDFTETWEFHIPYDVTNRICWITNNSSVINIKSTSALAENRVARYPLNFISNATDRLSVKYSILVNQYSLNEDEFSYWEKLQNITEDVGSLYDITPASIQNNLYCIENPNEKILGYFSVSAKSSQRIFISDNFSGLVNMYSACPVDTVYNNKTIPYLGVLFWVIEDATLYEVPPYKVLTDNKSCADCTVRGTTTKPDFWEEYK